MFKLEITLKGAPALPNQKTSWHWGRIAKETALWRQMARTLAMAQILPQTPLESVNLTLIRGSSRPVDFDNLIASFKAIIDGLRDARVIRDDSPNVVKTITPVWQKTKRADVFVKVIVTDSTPHQRQQNENVSQLSSEHT